MSSPVSGSHRYYFQSKEEITSYLERHPDSKDLKFSYSDKIKCPTKTLIEVAAKFFAEKYISDRSIKDGKIEEHIKNLFLQYENYKCMFSVKMKLSKALEDCLFNEPIKP